MVISLSKKIPKESFFYPNLEGGGSGFTSSPIFIELGGVTKIVPHTKKEVINIKKPKTKSRRLANASDVFDNNVLDLKRGVDELVINGWLDDDATNTAWEKYWHLRAMVVSGGPLNNLIVDNLTFDTTTQQCFLNDVSGTLNPNDAGDIHVSAGKDIARIEITLTFLMGDER